MKPVFARMVFISSSDTKDNKEGDDAEDDSEGNRCTEIGVCLLIAFVSIFDKNDCNFFTSFSFSRHTSS